MDNGNYVHKNCVIKKVFYKNIQKNLFKKIYKNLFLNFSKNVYEKFLNREIYKDDISMIWIPYPTEGFNYMK